MLVLTRKNGETISVGDSICIKVISVGNNRVKIGIEAPKEVPVRRGELQPRLAIFEPGDQVDVKPATTPADGSRHVAKPVKR